MNAVNMLPLMLPDALANALRERICGRELPPGEPLDELALAKSFGVERTPLRKALGTLAAEGIVEAGADRGWRVARITRADALQLLDMLNLLEGCAVRQAAETRAVIPLGEDFERALTEASGSACLPNMIRYLSIRLRLAFGPSWNSLRIHPSVEARAELGLAIASGDAEGALRLHAAHCESRRKLGIELFSPPALPEKTTLQKEFA